MQFSACDEATPSDDELNSIISPPKKRKMQVSTPANNAPCIRIEQLVKHDVWDIRKKDDGAFVMKKLTENDAGASANIRAINLNADTRTNAEQTGARPKVIVEVPKTNSAMTVNTANRLQSVNTDNTVTAKPGNAPRMEIIMPKKSVITLMPTNIQKNSVITLMPTNTQKNSVITINTTPAPLKNVLTAKTTASEKGSAAAAPEVEVITLSPDKEVFGITAAPSPRREVITINTKPFVKPTVFTINTSTKKDADTFPGQIKESMDMRNLPKENRGPVASASSIDIGPSVSREGKSDDVQSSSVPFYSGEVYQLQDMFPQVPLSVISENLRVCGSVESAIDNLLAQAVPESKPPSKLPHSSPSDDDDVVFIKSVKANKPKTDSTADGKKGGAVIKIELLTKNEVWDIKRKDKEGFVLKKNADTKTGTQYGMPSSSIPYREVSAEVKEEEHDPMLDDIFMDDMSHVGNLKQSDAPVKLMVYSKSSDSIQPSSERKNLTPLGEEMLDSAMEVDDDNFSYLQGIVSIETFEFSDDENEDGETVEHFLFKASLVLKKLRFRCETETQASEDSALLNITGSTKNEDASESVETKEDCTAAGSDEYYTDEYCTDEEDEEN